MSGAIPVLPLHSFIAWTEKNFTFLCLKSDIMQKRSDIYCKPGTAGTIIKGISCHRFNVHFFYGSTALYGPGPPRFVEVSWSHTL
jgi:hypothetical protein